MYKDKEEDEPACNIMSTPKTETKNAAQINSTLFKNVNVLFRKLHI